MVRLCKAHASADAYFAAHDKELQLPLSTGSVHRFTLEENHRDEDIDASRDAIKAHYGQQIAKLTSLGRIAPEQAASATATLKAAERTDLRLRRAIKQEDAKREACGYAQAYRALSDASDAESNTLLAICAYRCSSLREVRVKGDYLLRWTSVGSLDYPDMIAALVKSMADPNAPEPRPVGRNV